MCICVWFQFPVACFCQELAKLDVVRLSYHKNKHGVIFVKQSVVLIRLFRIRFALETTPFKVSQTLSPWNTISQNLLWCATVLHNSDLRRGWNCCGWCVSLHRFTTPPETPTSSIARFFLRQMLRHEPWKTGLHAQITYKWPNAADYFILTTTITSYYCLCMLCLAVLMPLVHNQSIKSQDHLTFNNQSISQVSQHKFIYCNVSRVNKRCKMVVVVANA